LSLLKTKIEIQIFFYKLVSFDFGFWLSKFFGIQCKKGTFFQKKAKKSKLQNFVLIDFFFGKKFFYEVLISIRRINVQKISKNGDDHCSDHGRLVDSYKNLLLIKIINRKFHVATEIGSTFFGCWSVTGQL
jgi:hypothetical protein